jgi:branched-chain amino acid transport system permease protein
MLALLPQVIVVGVLMGAVYALMALGITFIASIMKLINWAMGEFYMLGSYAQFLLISRWLGPGRWWLALPLAALSGFVLGVLLQRLLLAPMFSRDEAYRFEYATIVTIALSVLLQNAAVWLAGPYQSRPPDYLPTLSLASLGLALNGSRLAAAIAATAILLGFWFFVRRTTLGLAFLGAAQNRLGAQTAGINLARIDLLAFGIGVSLAAAAGALLAPIFLVYPSNGATAAVKGFEIIVIGGLGSIPGALIAGVLLGLVESLGAAFISSPYQNVYGFLLVLLVLVIRPHGLFGERSRTA